MRFSEPNHWTSINASGKNNDYTIRHVNGIYSVEIAPNNCDDEFMKDNLTTYYSLNELIDYIHELEEIRNRMLEEKYKKDGEKVENPGTDN